MQRKLLLRYLILLMVWASTAQGQDWNRYIPEKGRKNIIKRAGRGTGIAFLMRVQAGADIFWITDQVALALVSQMIDKERLTNEEADAKYRMLRDESKISFLIYTGSLNSPNNLRPTFDPVGRNDIFLQRAGDQKTFSKGEVKLMTFDDPLQRAAVSGRQEIAAYIVTFSKLDRLGNPIVRNLNDEIEVQFSLSGKKVVLEFKIKDLVTRLEGL